MNDNIFLDLEGTWMKTNTTIQYDEQIFGVYTANNSSAQLYIDVDMTTKHQII